MASARGTSRLDLEVLGGDHPGILPVRSEPVGLVGGQPSDFFWPRTHGGGKLAGVEMGHPVRGHPAEDRMVDVPLLELARRRTAGPSRRRAGRIPAAAAPRDGRAAVPGPRGARSRPGHTAAGWRRPPPGQGEELGGGSRPRLLDLGMPGPGLRAPRGLRSLARDAGQPPAPRRDDLGQGDEPAGTVAGPRSRQESPDLRAACASSVPRKLRRPGLPELGPPAPDRSRRRLQLHGRVGTGRGSGDLETRERPTSHAACNIGTLLPQGSGRHDRA